MHIVSLTTDFGLKDYYVGSIKGSILSNGIPVLFADISHEVDNYNIVQAAYILKNAYQSFPEGSIHLVSVHNFYQNKPQFVAFRHNGHYFVGPDNGLFSLMFEDTIAEVFALENPKKLNHTIYVQHFFAVAVHCILNNQPLSAIGNLLPQLLQRHSLRPITGRDHIRGSVLHIDKFSNVILNIDRAVFERIGQQRKFELYFKRNDPITSISNNYADVAAGEVLCLFNAAGMLEIAINLDKAATLFGLEIDDAIQIDFIE